jgi:hypothetical protein
VLRAARVLRGVGGCVFRVTATHVAQAYLAVAPGERIAKCRPTRRQNPPPKAAAEKSPLSLSIFGGLIRRRYRKGGKRRRSPAFRLLFLTISDKEMADE